MNTKPPAISDTPDTQQKSAEPQPPKRPGIRVRTHVRAGDGLYDSQNSDIRLKDRVETLEGALEKLARIEIDLSDA
jgi:hypothetical protein